MVEPNRTMSFVTRIFPFLEHCSARFRTAFLLSFAVLTIAWLATTIFMAFTPFSGDEGAYRRAAVAIAEFITGNIGAGRAAEIVVGNGWFMPGVPIALTPLVLATGGAALGAVRIYITLLNFALWVWAIRECGSRLGALFGFAMLVFPAICLTWLFFKSAIWGDLPAGLVMAIAVARLYTIAIALKQREAVGWTAFVQLGAVLALAVYFRGSLHLFSLAVAIFLAAIAAIFFDRTHIRRQTLALGAGAATFLLLLAPWMITASTLLKAPVITTTTINLSLGITFGDQDKVCFGPCPEGNIWYKSAAFSRELAEKTGRSELDVQREMAANALAGLTVQSYVSKVRRHFFSFLLAPHGFNGRFIGASEFVTNRMRSPVGFISKWLNNVPYFIFFAFAIIANFHVERKSGRSQILGLMLKMGFLSLLVQPFIHPSHPRYWVTFAPLMAISAGYVLTAFRSGMAVPYMSRASDQADAPSTFLTILQAGYVMTFVLAAAALFLLG